MMDKKQQRQVWQRVYSRQPAVPPIPKQPLGQMHKRLQQDLRVWEGYGDHPIYGPAFQRMADHTRQQLQMLERILQG